MYKIPQVGQKSPNFSLPNQDGNFISLDDFPNQWIVLYFYPKDDTPGCTVEAKDFTEYEKDFRELGAMILGVSLGSEQSKTKFIKKHNLSITLLSDSEHQVAEAYGIWQLKKFMGREFMGIVRSTFLISPNRIIAHSWTKVNSAKGHAQAVLNKLRELSANNT
jgi:peroxiredoxin Q/BCP